MESEARIATIQEVVTKHVRDTLVTLRGNKSAAARALGIDRRTLYRMLRRENGKSRVAHARSAT